MNSHLTLKISRLCAAYRDVGQVREQELVSFENLRNSLLLRGIRALKELIGSVLRFSPEGVRRREAPNNLNILDHNPLRPE